MAAEIPYSWTYEGEDEDGQPERWVFAYRRPSTAALILWAGLGSDENQSSIEGLRQDVEAAEMILRWIEHDGERITAIDVPHTLLLEGAAMHPNFRRHSSEPAEGAAGDSVQSGAGAGAGAE